MGHKHGCKYDEETASQKPRHLAQNSPDGYKTDGADLFIQCHQSIVNCGHEKCHNCAKYNNHIDMRQLTLREVLNKWTFAMHFNRIYNIQT